MAAGSNNTTFINPSSSGFPPYLDFNTLRTNAINYLGPITGKYWTDYNVHDPGITTLEVLLYAIMDLGYRANLPIDTLLATDASADTPDSNFFSPAQVFGCNPTVILDYRKMLMDIDEVRNAWLEPDRSRIDGVKVNGLYKIYLETERDQADFPGPGEWRKYKDPIELEVRKLLHAYRNLCEDFGEIVFLRKRYIGVSADIEIVPGANAADAYQAVVKALFDFFSPVPTFYTLGQLTNMGVSLDTVFEGRPLTGRSSHGFLLDKDMPVRLTGKIPIYRSAVFQQILGVASIKTIRTLELLDEDKNPLKVKDAGWVSEIPADAFPAFSLTASSFRWYQGGQFLSTDLSSYNSALQANAAHSGKVLYPAGSPALDSSVPKQSPPEDLGTYYSIQNDFPQVYGIGPGGLPPTATTLRQSQARQFKGYLLFFDQLLADYLSQLSNIRSIFSMAAPTDGNGSTYFGGDLSSVPDLDVLLRFPPPVAGGGGAGAMLMTPVGAKEWKGLVGAAKEAAALAAAAAGTAGTATGTAGIASGNAGPILSAAKVAGLSTYTFQTGWERNTAVATLTVLFDSEQLEVKTIRLDNGLWMYYLCGIDDEFVLISHNNFSNPANAVGEAKTVLYIGAFKESYSLVSLSEISSYSFTLVGSSASYYSYLQSILEDPARYTERRTAFLQHLMARFAESFTDYVLLEAGFSGDQQIAQNQVGLMQRFLGDWPALSADRARAFDFRVGGWGSSNISGFEKRFKAYCGIEDWRRHYLCPFEVHRMEAGFNIILSLAGETLFNCPVSFREKEAFTALLSLFAELGGRDNCRAVYKEAEKSYFLEIVFHGVLVARSVRSWADEMGAKEAAENLYRMWQLAPVKTDSPVSEYQYRPQLLDRAGRMMRTGIEGTADKAAAFESGIRMLGEINKPSIWVLDQPAAIGELCRNRETGLPFDQFIDEDRFKIFTKQDVVGKGKSKRWSFAVLDEGNSFRFRSLLDFGTAAEARKAGCQLLHLLTDPRSYLVGKEPGEWNRIVIGRGGIEYAESDQIWDTQMPAAERIPFIVEQVSQHLYTLRVISKEFRWRFNFYLGLPGWGSFVFESLKSFDSYEMSQQAALAFHESGPDWMLSEEGEDILLEARLPDGGALFCRLGVIFRPSSFAASVPAALRHLLEAKKDLYRLAVMDKKLLHQLIVPDEASKEGSYVYRLVDKDHPRAFHMMASDLTAAEAEALREQLILKGREGYPYLEICLGGDNVRSVVGASDQVSGYAYQLRCRNDYFSKSGLPKNLGELVLFESQELYSNADEAGAAFQDLYLTILKKAGDPKNYGNGKYISLEDRGRPRPDTTGAGADVGAGTDKPVVFVPAATRDVFDQAGREVVLELVKAVLSYPIRVVEGRTRRYRFVLGNGIKEDWGSAVDYPTTADAHTAFGFFRLLLNFPGNYFIDQDWEHCRHRIGIREVLAESTHAFPDEAAAWGSRGVERFICVAQTAGGFHLNMRKDCTYSYFVACPNRRAVHPCTYETAAKRDAALHRLMEEAGHFPAGGWLSGESGKPDKHHFELLDGRGHRIARVPLPDVVSEEAVLNRVLDIADAIWAGVRPEQFGSEMQLVVKPADHSKKFAISPAEHWTEVEWMRRLSAFAAYFPLVRDVNKQGEQGLFSYRLELKLPGFPDLPGNQASPGGCGCPPDDGSACYIAWKCEKVFGLATPAWNALLGLLPLLLVKENYRPVFGEEIECFGIELHEKGEVLARNPQTYSYPAMAVDSVHRASRLTNTEGLDVVEHLLLRPKNNGQGIPVCKLPGPCSSIWPAAVVTDAAGEQVLPFQPGVDPYSFIMTVALPAWPERFRKKENRVLLESILQREAPAHILVRILWLTPRDMCKFEYFYSGWIDALSREARERHACKEFKAAEFIDFLFDVSLACLPECEVCGDGVSGVAASDAAASAGAAAGAGGRMSITGQGEEWLDQIDRLYCWKDRKCAEVAVGAGGAAAAKTTETTEVVIVETTEAIEAMEALGAMEIVEATEALEIAAILAVVETAEVADAIGEDATRPGEEAAQAGEDAVQRGEDAAQAEEVLTTDNNLIRKVQRARNKRYEEKIKVWRQGAGEETLAGEANSFLLELDPSIDRFEDVIKKIMKAPRSRKGKAAKNAEAEGHRQALASIVFAAYLDRIAIKLDDEERWRHLRAVLQKFGIRIEDQGEFYREWQSQEMEQLVRNLNTDRIRSLIAEVHKKTE